MRLNLELSGGLELLFGNKKVHELELGQRTSDAASGSGGEWTLGDLIPWVRDNLLTERPELFTKGNTVRPGILVLLNDCDWELSGMLDSVLHDGDVVTFISTLHGG
ncbi:ubiquitin-related modifier 1 homolog, partial [Haematococcus lacustris]